MKEARDPLRKYSKAITKGGLLKEGEIFATIAPIIGKDEAAYVLYDQPVILKNDRLNTIAEKTYERLMRDGKTKEEASAEIRRRLQGVTKEFYQK
jgi:hypothetical protein